MGKEKLEGIRKVLEGALENCKDPDCIGAEFKADKDEVKMLLDGLSRLEPCETEVKAVTDKDTEEVLKMVCAMQLMNIVEKLQDMEPVKMPKTTLDSTENRSPFHSTVEGMLSADYREGFKAEYQQTKIRYEELKALNNRIEAEKISKKTGLPAHDCPDTILRAQQAAMGEYLHILEVRAVIEGIEL